MLICQFPEVIVLGLLLRCHLQDSGRGFQALSDGQHAAHAH